MKSLITATPEEVMNMLQQGLISEDQANEYYLKNRIGSDFYGMDPDEVEEAYNRKLVDESQVNKYISRRENPVWFFVKDIAQGAVYGVQSGIEEMAQAANSIWNLVTPKLLNVAPEPKMGIIEKPDTLPGQLTGGLSQAMTGFIPAHKTLTALEKATRLGELAASAPKIYEFGKSILAGMVGDSISFDPYDGRLSNIIEEHPALHNPITDFLKAEPGDPEAEARLKNALEGALVGSAFDLIFAGIKGIKGKVWADKANVQDEVIKTVDEVFQPALPPLYEVTATVPNPLYKNWYDNIFNQYANNGRLFIETGENGSYRLFGSEATLKEIQEKLNRGLHTSTVSLGPIEKSEATNLPFDIERQLLGWEPEVKKPEVEKPAPVKTAQGPSQPNVPEAEPRTTKGRIKPSLPGEPVILSNEEKERLAAKYMAVMKGEETVSVYDLYDTPSGPFNLEKFDNVEGMYESFQVISDELSQLQKKMTGGKQSLENMVLGGEVLDAAAVQRAEGKLSKYLDISLNDIRAHYAGVKNGAARMMRDMQFLEGYSQFVIKYVKEAKTDAEKLAAVEHIYRLAEAQMLVKGIQSQTARSLTSLRNVRRSRVPFSSLTPDDMSQLMMDHPGLQKIIQQAGLIKDPETMMKFANKTIRAKILDGILEWRQAALLSSTGTMAVNFLGTGAATILKAIEHSLAISYNAITKGDMDKLRQIQYFGAGMVQGLVNAFKLKSPKVQAKLVKEAVSDKGFFEGMRVSYDRFLKDNDIGLVWKALLSAESQLDMSTKFNRGPALPNWALGPIVRLPFHVLTASDEFFKSVSYWGSVYSQAFDAAHILGKTGKDLDNFVKLFANNIPEEAHYTALKAAREATFSEGLDPQGAMGSITTGINRMTWAKILFIPFWKIGVNIIRFAGRRTPLALLTQSTRETLAKGGIEATETMMKMATGTSLMALGSWLYSQGIITGAAPKGQEAAWKNAGIGENSIKIGDKWIEYTRLEPVSLLFRISADITRLIENYQLPEEERDELIIGGLHIIQNLLSDSYMKSLRDFIDAMTDENFPMAKWANRQIGTFFPASAGLAQINRGQDPTVRDVPTTIGLKEAWDSFISAYDPEKLLPKRHPVYGTPLERDPRLLAAFNTYVPDDPVTKEMALIGLNMKEPSRSRVENGVRIKLTDQQYDQYMEEISKFPIQETLAQIIQSPDYQGIKDRDSRANLLRGVVSEFRSAAWAMYLSKDEQLRDKLITKTQKKANAMIGLESNLTPTEQMRRIREVLQDVE